MTKLQRRIDIKGGPLTVPFLDGPLKNREIKMFARMDDKPPEVNFADRPYGIQVRCGVFSQGTEGRMSEHTR